LGLEFELSPIRDYGGGDYLSNPTDSDLVLIDTRSFNKRILRSKRNGDLCHAMDSGLHKNGPLESVPDEFSYGWTDDCRDGQCDVEISLCFSGIDIEEITGGRSNQLDIVMYSMISDVTIEDDPFRESRNLTTSLIEAEYKKFGTSRTLVKCQFTPGGHGSGTFHTMPQ